MARSWLAVLVLLAIVAVPNVSADKAATVNNAGELWEALANPAVSTVTIDGARPHPGLAAAGLDIQRRTCANSDTICGNPTGRVRLTRDSWPGTAIVGPGRHVTLQSGTLLTHAAPVVSHLRGEANQL